MPQKPQTETCEVCHESFEPDARVGDRQRVCRKRFCQEERKRRSQQAWLAKNPGYFKGRYPQLKEQIRNNQAQHRVQKTPPQVKSALTIQDELTFYKNRLIPVVLNCLAIQDEITSQITKSKRDLRQVIKPLYKTSQPHVIV